MNIKKHIPNSLTLLNLLSGCLAIIALFVGKNQYIPYLIATALMADFLDGLVARALKVSSPIGKELDSLADLISFGVLPSMLMVYLSCKAFFPAPVAFNFHDGLSNIQTVKEGVFIFFPLIIAMFSALRLAKFNIDTEQSKEFKGLATPAATILVLGLFMVLQEKDTALDFLLHSWIINLIAVAIAFLLVSTLPMFSFKLSSFTIKDNKWQILFLILSVLFLSFFKFVGIPLIIVVYILLNLLKKLTP